MLDGEAEYWKQVPGWPSYEVSTLGRVRVIKTGKIRSTEVTPAGYVCVKLSKAGNKTTKAVHRLVAEAFIPNPNSKPNVLHWDDVGTNNKVSNLRWGTPKDNGADSVRNGKHPNTRKTHCKRGHKFTAENTYNPPNGQRVCRSCERLRENSRTTSET